MRSIAIGATLALALYAAPDKMLFDFRNAPERKATPIPAETQHKLLSAVFPRYLTKAAECKAGTPAIDATSLKAARDAGQIVPKLGPAVKGSFTKAGAAQTAYLIQVGECNAWTRVYLGTYRLAIFEGERLVAAADVNGQTIAAAADVNEDGIDEILISRCGYGQGAEECSATLTTIGGGSLRTIRDFKNVYEDPCGASAELRIHATAIRTIPGQTPRFFEDRYEAACPQGDDSPEFKPARPK